jgi:hypothetical protein
MFSWAEANTVSHHTMEHHLLRASRHRIHKRHLAVSQTRVQLNKNTNNLVQPEAHRTVNGGGGGVLSAFNLCKDQYSGQPHTETLA